MHECNIENFPAGSTRAYKANSESSYCNLRVCDIGVNTDFSSYDLLVLLIPHLRGNLLQLLKFENAIETGAIKNI